jgi:hypothetical protein
MGIAGWSGPIALRDQIGGDSETGDARVKELIIPVLTTIAVCLSSWFPPILPLALAMVWLDTGRENRKLKRQIREIMTVASTNRGIE